MRQRAAARVKILNGWKEIADYLRKGVRTVQRYERELGLPVRRPGGGGVCRVVIATKAELDGWISSRPIRDIFRLPQADPNSALALNEFKRHVTEWRQLHRHAAGLQKELTASLNVLRTTIEFAIPKLLAASSRNPLLKDSERRVLADVLSFDPKRKKAN